MNAFTVDGYEPDDEYRFLWGKRWRNSLENHRQAIEDNQNDRRALDAEGDWEEARDRLDKARYPTVAGVDFDLADVQHRVYQLEERLATLEGGA